MLVDVDRDDRLRAQEPTADEGPAAFLRLGELLDDLGRFILGFIDGVEGSDRNPIAVYEP